MWDRLKIIVVFALLGCLGQTWANYSEEESIPQTPVEFSAKVFTHNDAKFLALNYKNFPHWHTYWKNPGDAGLPIKANFKLDSKDLNLEELEWPAPKRFIEKGDILAFGYEGDYSLFFKLPENVKNGALEIHSTWLVCKHICIPGEKKLNWNLNDGLLKEKNDKLVVDDSELTRRIEALPKIKDMPADLDLVLAKDNKSTSPMLHLFYTLNDVAQQDIVKNINVLTPFPQEPFAFKREKLFKDKKNNVYARYNIEWDGEYMDPEVPLPSDGKFTSPYKLRFLYTDPKTKEVSVVEKIFTSISLDQADKLDSFFALVTEFSTQDTTPSAGTSALDQNQEQSAKTEVPSFIYYLLFAFIGGFILNFMPCVLPVISLKLFGLIKHSNESRLSILKHNVFYSLGVLFSFFVLVMAVLGLKAAGTSVGWGFQLQSPTFVALMLIVIFTMALNLFGLFEFKTPGGSKLGNVEIRNTFTGDFLSGVLATILSTPCSAPFLGTALTFAFTSGPIYIISIFMMIGLGLAFPFLLTGFFPSLISFLPRPGAWMEHLKKFLGLTLILTSVWLLDVFAALVDSSFSVIKMNTALALIFFMFYMWKNMSKKKAYQIPFIAATIALLVSALVVENKIESVEGQSAIVTEKRTSGLDWQEWSQAKMTSHQESKELTFVDFTAKWCFTCKVNEKLVIDTQGFRDLVAKKNVKLLLADWTRRDEKIGSWLKANGMVGVPAYFVINSKGELINLGETITLKEIDQALN
ncbi:disulfide bond corrector protein DsbC [Bacteriovorax sp. BSW11_IV]|uniref:protein-disulfide reductase DsbD family protein n=1 Tax=Bacteriovorax sp. BSW11_IV TaxID=1353529 RepID=UPI000389E72A|nr:thioredoxin family protein [Bacteriovorax sp. BSW11_IV]EQC50366.1 disulfide bond corrector protein DsbC [Bacteriovorax sp. BSW11_IV]